MDKISTAKLAILLFLFGIKCLNANCKDMPDLLIDNSNAVEIPTGEIVHASVSHNAVRDKVHITAADIDARNFYLHHYDSRISGLKKEQRNLIKKGIIGAFAFVASLTILWILFYFACIRRVIFPTYTGNMNRAWNAWSTLLNPQMISFSIMTKIITTIFGMYQMNQNDQDLHNRIDQEMWDNSNLERTKLFSKQDEMKLQNNSRQLQNLQSLYLMPILSAAVAVASGCAALFVAALSIVAKSGENYVSSKYYSSGTFLAEFSTATAVGMQRATTDVTHVAGKIVVLTAIITFYYIVSNFFRRKLKS